MADTTGAGDNRPRHERMREEVVLRMVRVGDFADLVERDEPGAVLQAQAQQATTEALLYVGDQMGRIADALHDEQGYGMSVADWLTSIQHTMRE